MDKLFTEDHEAKIVYANLTNKTLTAAWHICSCHKCSYAFAKCDESEETTVHWKALRAARSAFGFDYAVSRGGDHD